MVEFEMNVTQDAWNERLFDCEATAEGARKMNTIARRYQGQRLRPNEEILTIEQSKDEFGLDIIGSGKTRVAINLPDDWHTGTHNCIAKIQWDPTRLQTLREINVWQGASGRAAALLAPILDHPQSKQWVIMPEAEMYTEIPWSTTSDIADKLRNKLRDEGYKASDIRPANIGRVEGRDVVIDYGVLRKR